MKKIYFAVVLAAFAFSACSNDPDDNSPSSSSNLDKSSSSNPGNSSSSKPDEGSGSAGCLTKRDGINVQCLEESSYFGEEFCTIMQGEWVNSCPPGGEICEQDIGEDFASISHFYDAEHNPCSPLYSSSSIITNTTSSSSSVPYSSSVAIVPSSSSIVSDSSSSSNPSSDSNSEYGACYMDILPDFNISMCAEGIAEPITRSECEETGEVEGWTVNFQSSCPSEYVLKCEQDEGNVYLYGMMITILGMTCEDLLEE